MTNLFRFFKALVVQSVRIALTESRSLRKYFRTVLGPDAQFTFPYVIALLIARESNELSEAYVQWASRLFPTNAQLRFHHARLLFHKGMHRESHKEYIAAFRLIGSMKGKIPDDCYDQYGVLLKETHRPEIVNEALVEIFKRVRTDAQFRDFFKGLANIGVRDLALELLSVNSGRLKNAFSTPVVFDLFEVTPISAPGIATRLDVLKPESKMTFHEPEVFEDSSERPPREVTVPATWLATIEQVTVAGAYTLLKDRQLICYEPAAHPRNGLVAGCWKYVTGFTGHDSSALVVYPYKRTLQFTELILLSGRCSSNFFHYLIEYLPRLWAIEQRPELANIPLMVDQNMAPQHFEVLRLLANGRAIVEFDHQTLVQAETVFVPSTPTYLPDRFDIPYWLGGAVSETHIQFLRNGVLPALQGRTNKTPKRIYLSRLGISGRKLKNEKALQDIFASFGFEMVYPEQLTFLEQVELFHGADVIAGPGGAALSNAIFCRPGTHVIALVSDRNKGFSIHANLANAVGARFTYVTGPNTRARKDFSSEAEYAYSAFHIDEAKLTRALKALLR